MAKICNSRAKLYEIRGSSSEEPFNHVESEGERMIKEMVQKQLNTHTNLHKELKRELHFDSVTEIVPITEYVAGEVTLEKFQDTTEKAAYIEDLKSLGIPHEEVNFLISYNNEKYIEKSKRNESSFLSTRYNCILHKIEQARQRRITTSQSSCIRSHEKDIGLSVKPNSEHTKLLNFVLSCKKSKVDNRPPDHPIHKLKAIEDDLFGHLSKRPKTALATMTKTPVTEESLPYLLPYKNGESLWDVKSKGNSKLNDKRSCQGSKHIYTCKPEYLYTIKNGSIVSVSESKTKDSCPENNSCEQFVVSDISQSNVALIPLETISENRISIDDIKSMPRFSYYTEGVPSQVLYLKNLARGFTRIDLLSIFGHFESNKDHRIMYRLMTGRMKGQAFVTFPTISSAQEALQQVNGFIFKGKPIIIQYSKPKVND